MQRGWVKVDRGLLETDLWHDVTTYRLYMYLLLKATHQECSSLNGIELAKGQWIRSYRKLAQDLAYKEGRGLKEYSLKTIKKCVDKLVKAGIVTVQETEVGTLFTLLGSASQQAFEEVEAETVNGTVPKQETNGKRTVNNNKKGEHGKNEINKEHIRSQIENLRVRYSENQLKVIDDYLAMIVHTRASGKISDSVILKMYEAWDKHPAICVEYGLKTHTQNPTLHSKKENYTLGIIRNTSAEEATSKLNVNQYSNVTPFRKKDSLFAQSEESKRRQAAAEASLTEEEWQKTLEDLEAFKF